MFIASLIIIKERHCEELSGTIFHEAISEIPWQSPLRNVIARNCRGFLPKFRGNLLVVSDNALVTFFTMRLPRKYAELF